MIETVPAEALGPWSLVGLAVVSVLTGLLVPRRTYKDKIRECELKDQQIRELAEQNNILLREIGPAITGLAAALRRPPKNGVK